MPRRTAEPGGEEPSALGDLETDVMKVVWTGGWISVRDVYETLRKRRGIAYTTVMTVMARLHDKKMLDRDQDGRTYLYRARRTRGEVARTFLRRMLDRLFDGRRADAVTALLEEGDRLDPSDVRRIRAALEDMEKREGKPDGSR
jgi:predicted transcriptional regulator